jgi:hypothetical protein
VWFSHSGHEPFVDEPGGFNATMIDMIRPMVRPSSLHQGLKNRPTTTDRGPPKDIVGRTVGLADGGAPKCGNLNRSAQRSG